MSGSWGHTIRRMTADELERQAADRERWGARFYSCASRGCDEPGAFKTEYRYVTGRAGRVSSSERTACDVHGRRFAEKHGLEVPTEPAPRTSRTGGMIAGELMRELRGSSS